MREAPQIEVSFATDGNFACELQDMVNLRTFHDIVLLTHTLFIQWFFTEWLQMATNTCFQELLEIYMIMSYIFHIYILGEKYMMENRLNNM